MHQAHAALPVVLALGLVLAPDLAAVEPDPLQEGIAADGYLTNLVVFGGLRLVDDAFDRFTKVEWPTVGIAYQGRDVFWPLALDTGLAYSTSGSGHRLEADTIEFWFGAVKPWTAGPLEFNAGGGFTASGTDMTLDLGGSEIDDTAGAFGVYGTANLHWAIGDRYLVSLVSRFGFAEMRDNPVFGDEEVNGSGVSVGLGLGGRY